MQNVLDIVRFLKPKPSPYQFVRVGGQCDGAYLVPEDLQAIEACFSPGVANRKDFEDELFDNYRIVSHMCDKSSDREKFKTALKPGQTFRKVWLGATDNDETITLSSWVKKSAPGRADLLLQMDIEGAEYDAILATNNRCLNRFRIIVMELHGLGRVNSQKALEFMLPFFSKLDANHHCIHLHPNNCADQVRIEDTDYWIPKVLEVTLLRKDRFLGHDKLFAPKLPNPLDIEYNVRHMQPQAMGPNWGR